MSTSDNIPIHIHPIYTPESLTPTVVCDLRKKKKISSPSLDSTVTMLKRIRGMEINLLFAVFLIPFLITREKSPLELTETTEGSEGERR